MMNKVVYLVGVAIIICFVSLAESPNSILHHENERESKYPYFPVINENNDSEEVSQTVDETELDGLVPTLELQLVDTVYKDDVIVEKYQQFEVYRNDEQEVIKATPLDEYEYLSYQQ